MKRRYNDCRKCDKFRHVYSALDGKWLVRCMATSWSEGGVSFEEILRDKEEDWNGSELPIECVYYADRFVEECNEKKA